MPSQLAKDYAIPASACIAEMRQQKVSHVVTVPDWVQLSLHAQLDLGADGIELINTCNENQAVTVGAGLTLGGRRPLLVMQNQGLYNCVNTLRAICLDAHIPMVLMVGQFGREFDNLGRPSTASRRTMVRIMEPVLGALGMAYHGLDSAADLPKLGQAFDQAATTRSAVVLLVSAPLAWS